MPLTELPVHCWHHRQASIHKAQPASGQGTTEEMQNETCEGAEGVWVLRESGHTVALVPNLLTVRGGALLGGTWPQGSSGS